MPIYPCMSRTSRSLTLPISSPPPQLSGYLLVNRVPGNFHIEARSKAHNLNAVRCASPAAGLTTTTTVSSACC